MNKMKNVISINKDWQFIRKEGEEPVVVNLPHTWNAVDGQDGGNDYYRGTCVYIKQFSMPDHEADEEVWLRINGAAYTSDVFLNGKKLYHNENGFAAYCVDLTPCLQAENELKILVDNRENDHVYPQTADFTFYGGLYRDVNLVIVNRAHFDLSQGMSGVHATPILQDDGMAKIRLEAWVSGGDSVTFATAGQTLSAPVKDGMAITEFTIASPHLWDGLDDPYLYDCQAELFRNGVAVDRVNVCYGIRSIQIDPEKGFLLNGRSYPLRGVARHQDRMGRGNAISHDDMEEDMAIILELGANVIRLAHYQHDQYFYDLCDQKGICVWAEIPYITRYMKNGDANTCAMMKDLVTQCYNHPSIVAWGLSNEITAGSEVDEDMLANHHKLNDLCHHLDPIRPTSMASVFMLETDSPLNRIPDANAYNLYFGWYLGSLNQNEDFFDAWHKQYPDRAIGFTEYGADANPAFHSDQPAAGDYSEEYQFVYHEHMLKMISERPWIWITSVWNMFDFAADGRDEGGKHGQNQKGLVTFDRRIRKDAYYLYKAYWSKEPFVHLCGRRWLHRIGNETEITVCTNQPKVSLYINDRLIGAKTGEHVFRFRISLHGVMHIRAVSGSLEDEMELQQVEKEDSSYFIDGGRIHNWFSAIDFDPACYSVNDTLGELSGNEQTAVILKKVMAKAMESRGDVAKRTSGNVNLMKMMSGMKFSDLLKKAGGDVCSEKMLQEINSELQKIRK